MKTTLIIPLILLFSHSLAQANYLTDLKQFAEIKKCYKTTDWDQNALAPSSRMLRSVPSWNDRVMNFHALTILEKGDGNQLKLHFIQPGKYSTVSFEQSRFADHCEFGEKTKARPSYEKDIPHILVSHLEASCTNTRGQACGEKTNAFTHKGRSAWFRLQVFQRPGHEGLSFCEDSAKTGSTGPGAWSIVANPNQIAHKVSEFSEAKAKQMLEADLKKRLENLYADLNHKIKTAHANGNRAMGRAESEMFAAGLRPGAKGQVHGCRGINKDIDKLAAKIESLLLENHYFQNLPKDAESINTNI
ncbi:MAG: hypothetical protein KDD33_09790 [Bdellovibrionales bacterium]|nr:hypothetical protein [Bdellovibrionales bacterium]